MKRGLIVTFVNKSRTEARYFYLFFSIILLLSFIQTKQRSIHNLTQFIIFSNLSNVCVYVCIQLF